MSFQKRVINAIYWRLFKLLSKIELLNIRSKYNLPSLKNNRLELLQLMQSLNEHISNIDLLIDVGCNEGLFTKTFRMFKKFDNAILIEPNEILIPKIKENTNIIENAFIQNVALSHSVEEVEYYYHKDSQMNSLIKSDDTKLSRDFGNDKEIDTRKIRTITLDISIRDSDIDLDEFSDIFLKLDTQGNEIDILKGGVHSLKKVKYCLVEYMVSSPYMDNRNLNDLILLMDQQNFNYIGTVSLNKRTNFEIGATNLLFKKKL